MTNVNRWPATARCILGHDVDSAHVFLARSGFYVEFLHLPMEASEEFLRRLVIIFWSDVQLLVRARLGDFYKMRWIRKGAMLVAFSP
ncbi:hypothetical protein NLM33_35460 [Bradyrhizobium sp. CCGUVB1N3]|uniref:hypothetical protein n=1 Tax=Bradyrhizobium sp. CCGUVB1N3 TaxID=2949629 RepID=UPI0020B187B9|nr:hypothetical protein [Bradyrhizobium sp. CCGUVB1N3]MCP3475578.1 hypothetical protein [Bradyrhizobium sp. CCGUVB1N3]